MKYTPALFDDTLYIGSRDGYVYSIDTKTGKEKWKYKTNDEIASSPTVTEDSVYIGSSDTFVYALDATTGDEEWKYKTGGSVSSSPALSGGTIYIGSRDTIVYALDATTGAEKWKYKTGGGVTSSPAVSNGVVYIGSEDSYVYALDAITGKEKWKFKTKNKIRYSTSALSGGTVYIGSSDTFVYALNATTGAEKWKYKTGGEVGSSPTVSGNTIYIGSMDTYLYSLDATTGREKWKYKTDKWIWPSSPTVSNGIVYIGSYDGNVYAFTPTKKDTVVATVQPSPTTSVSSDNIPKLIFPLTGAVLYDGSGGSSVWDFDWSDVEGASEYHLYVIGPIPPAEFPIVDTITTSSSYRHVSSGYVVSKNYYGWTWRVRAKINGQWSEWSETGNFDVGKVPTKPPTSYPISSATSAPTYTSVATPLQTPYVLDTPPPQQNKTNMTTFIFGGIAILIGLVLLVSKSRWKNQGTSRPTSPTPIPTLSPVSHAAQEAADREQKQMEMQRLAELRNDASSKLKRAESMLNQTAQLGIDTSQLEDILAKAEQAFQKENYTHTIDNVKKYIALIDQAEKNKKQLEQMRRSASDKIISAIFSIEKAERIGVTIKNAREINTKAQSAFDANDYNSAIRFANKSKDTAEQLINESKPSISIELPPKMEYKAWKHQDLIVTNKGTAHAVAITITFLTSLEVRDFKNIKRLDAGEQKTINVNIKPTEKGEVPVDYIVGFKDLMDRVYKTEDTATIQISTEIASEISDYQPMPPVARALSENVDVRTKLDYKGATIIYKVKVVNNTTEAISDVKFYPYVPDLFLLKENVKLIPLIEPKRSQTVTFEIRPTSECGTCNVAGRMNYYDGASKNRKDIEFEAKSLSIICPVLHRQEITEDMWGKLISNLIKAEETGTDIPIDGKTLFRMVSRTIKDDMPMHMLEPETTKGKVFNAVARFYAEGVGGLKYMGQVEVIGGVKKSTLLLKAWAEKEDALTGFFYGILDKIMVKIDVKGYTDEPIIQNYFFGNYAPGGRIIDLSDKTIQISTESRKCPNCGMEVKSNEKFCFECGAKL